MIGRSCVLGEDVKILGMSDHMVIIYLVLCVEFTGYKENLHSRSAIALDITQHMLITY